MAVTNFFWDEQNLLQEYDVGGTTVAHYVTEPSKYGNAFSQRYAGADRFYHHNAVGSLGELTNSFQLVTDVYHYEAFGRPTSIASSTTCPFTFGGQSGYYTDAESSTLYVRKRHYSAILGRWLSVDPLFNEMHSVYAYVSSNPVNVTDPSGMILIPAVCITCCIGGTLCAYFCLDVCYDIAAKGQGDFATCMWDCWNNMPLYAKIVCGAAGVVCFACLIRVIAKTLPKPKGPPVPANWCPCFCGPLQDFVGVIPRELCFAAGCICIP